MIKDKMEEETKYYIKLCLLLFSLIFILIIIHNNTQYKFGRWHPYNHCDALCYGKYGTHSKTNNYHNETTVIPLKISDKGMDKYICICDEGNITTRWTYV